MSDTYEDMVKNGVTIDELIKALRDTELPGDAKVKVEHIFNLNGNPEYILYDTIDVDHGVAIIKVDTDYEREK